MRHRNRIKTLGRTRGPRKSLLRHLAASLIMHGRITTTLAKAQSVRPYVEQLITKGRNATLSQRRLLISALDNPTAVRKIMTDLGPRYAKRNGGYTRIIKRGRRVGDGGETAVIELV